MKKLLALVLAMVMVLSLAACGGEEEEYVEDDQEYVEDVQEDAEEVQDEAEDEAEDLEEDVEEGEDLNVPVSDESFAVLQETFAELVSLYDQVVELYSADEIAADENINANLAKTQEVMTTMAGLTQENMTEQDAVNLLEAMGMLGEALGLIVDSMEAA